MPNAAPLPAAPPEPASGGVLIVYSTTDGHTRAICERLSRTIAAQGEPVTLRALADAGADDLRRHAKVVVGASIRYGRHGRRLEQFVADHVAVLHARPNAFFSVNLTARKPDKNRPETNPYVRKFLSTVPWRPQLVDVFAGRLDYPRYRLADRLIIRFIMALTGGPTDPRAVVEYTDWQRVDAFARRVAALGV